MEKAYRFTMPQSGKTTIAMGETHGETTMATGETHGLKFENKRTAKRFNKNKLTHCYIGKMFH